TVTHAKSRGLNRKFVSINSSNSATHGPHQVAHTLISRTLPDLLARNSCNAFASAGETVTGSLWTFSSQRRLDSILSSHLVEQPKTFVVVTGGSLPARRASMTF